MSIQFTVPGFRPMTFGDESLPITTRAGLPPKRSLLSDRRIAFNFCDIKI